MGSSDVKVLTVSDTNAADADRLVTAARPNTSATMAATTHAGGAARNVTVTTLKLALLQAQTFLAML
jgi:hypothetical protein